MYIGILQRVVLLLCVPSVIVTGTFPGRKCPARLHFFGCHSRAEVLCPTTYCGPLPAANLRHTPL